MPGNERDTADPGSVNYAMSERMGEHNAGQRTRLVVKRVLTVASIICKAGNLRVK